MRHFPNWIEAYIGHVAPVSESPQTFHFWTAVSTLAGALRRRVWIDMLHFKWFPNFYIILVAPAGLTAKSTSIGLGKTLLAKVDQVYIGPQSLTWQALAKAMSEAIQDVTYVSNLGKPEIDTFCAMTVSISELGTFLKMEDAQLMEALIPFWDSQDGTWNHATITGGLLEVESPCLNLIGCTTPSWVKIHFPEGMIGGGLASRLVFVYGDAKSQFMAYPSRHVPPQTFKDDRKRLLEDLQHIALLKGEYHLTEDALTWGEAWYKHHWTSRPLHMASDRYSGYIARKQTHIHKLAMVYAASQRDEMHISQSDLEFALAIVESVEPQMQKVFDSIGAVSEAKNAQTLVGFVQAYGWLSSAQLWKCVQMNMTTRDFQDALKGLVQAGTLKAIAKDGTMGVVLGKVE